ncbi:uncharacterized protein LOC144936548 [Lampetra fluviatilis]
MNPQYQRLDEAGGYRPGPMGVPMQDVCAGVVVVGPGYDRGGPPPSSGSPPVMVNAGPWESGIVSEVRDYLAWSLCSMMHVNVCCLGFLAAVFSIKARDRKHLHDAEGARHYGNISLTLNIIALLLGLVVCGLFIYGVIMLANSYVDIMHKLDHENQPSTFNNDNNMNG